MTPARVLWTSWSHGLYDKWLALAWLPLAPVLFDVMDANGDSGLDKEEIEYLLRAMNEGNTLFQERNATQVLDDFDSNHDGLLQFEEFTALVKRYPVVIYPYVQWC